MTRPLFERIFNENNSVGGFLVDMNLNVINNKRSIYNALDCLGDVGGLFDMLLFLGGLAVRVSMLIFGNGLNLHLRMGSPDLSQRK